MSTYRERLLLRIAEKAKLSPEERAKQESEERRKIELINYYAMSKQDRLEKWVEHHGTEEGFEEAYKAGNEYIEKEILGRSGEKKEPRKTECKTSLKLSKKFQDEIERWKLKGVTLSDKKLTKDIKALIKRLEEAEEYTPKKPVKMLTAYDEYLNLLKSITPEQQREIDERIRISKANATPREDALRAWLEAGDSLEAFEEAEKRN